MTYRALDLCREPPAFRHGENQRKTFPGHYYSQFCAKAAQRKARTGSEYRAWKRTVLERDEHTCRMCGTTERKVVAHHIVGLAESPDLKLELSNGMTLCLVCHDVMHDMTGKSDNMLGGLMRQLKRGGSYGAKV